MHLFTSGLQCAGISKLLLDKFPDSHEDILLDCGVNVSSVGTESAAEGETKIGGLASALLFYENKYTTTYNIHITLFILPFEQVSLFSLLYQLLV